MINHVYRSPVDIDIDNCVLLPVSWHFLATTVFTAFVTLQSRYCICDIAFMAAFPILHS